MDSVDPTRRRTAKSTHDHWPSPPSLRLVPAPHWPRSHAGDCLPTAYHARPTHDGRAMAELAGHDNHATLARFRRRGDTLALHEASRHPCVTSPGPCSRHIASNTLRTSQTASSQSSTWPISPPLHHGHALTALTPVSPLPSPPMACPRAAVHPLHRRPLRGYKSPRPLPLLTTPAPRLSCTI